MRRSLSAIAVALGATALSAGAAVGPASADVPVNDYSRYVTISGPAGLVTGGDWGVWTLQAKNPNAVADDTDHLVFNTSFLSDAQQLQLQYRAGTSGAWTTAPVSWHQMSSNPLFSAYLGSLDLTGKPLKLAPHSVRTFQLRARRVPTSHITEPFPIDFSAFLTPAEGQYGQGGNFVARADTGVNPLGLTTTITGLPTTLPANGMSRLFQIHMNTLNQANWQIPTASFFVWQGQKYGQMGGPKPCDAEIDVWDAAHRSWHKVGMQAAGIKDMTVDLAHWATGPAWNRTLNARITLGAGFRSGPDGSIGFGYYPGSGDPDYFWAHQKLTSTAVSGAPACVKPASGAPSGGGTGSTGGTGGTGGTGTTGGTTGATGGSGSSGGSGGGSTLADTGGGSNSGLIAGAGAALIALGAGIGVALRRRGRKTS